MTRKSDSPALCLSQLACAGGVILAAACLFFGPMLWRDEVFAFRDAGLFYYPLFQWTTWEWGAGRVPLWNPYEGWGTPILADATSSLFYPGKWLFVLPLSFSRLLVLYAALHCLLSAGGMFWLTRVWKASVPAATIAAVAYAFGGSVLFQVSNVVFLVGAAWLPWGVCFLWHLLARPTWQAVAGLSAVLAMLVLGGDPQMVVHLAIVALIGLLIRRRWWQTRERRSLIAIPLAFAAAGGLAAVQILPSAAYISQTDRAVYERPRNIYEAASATESQLDGLCGVPVAATQHAQLYDFSLGPWRWLELWLPNISGRLFPKHERWLSYLPAEASVWTPSLYMGFLPVLWGVTQLRWFGGRRRVRWLTWIATFFAIGSLGWFGGGWFVREFAHSVLGWDTTEWWLGQPTGGLYWLLVVAVPGYVQFRYPAKLWTLVAFALACLAATGFDHGWRLGKRNSKLLAYSAIAACCAGSVAYLLAPGIFARGNFGPDDLWGPFQAETAAWRVVQSCSHTALIASVGWLIFYIKARPPRAAWLCVFVVLADMYVANAWLLPTIPASQLAPPRNMDTAAGITRVDPGNWRNDFPPHFRTVSSADRAQDALRYDRERGYGRLHLLDGVGSLRPYTTFVPADYDLWQQVGGRLQFPTRVWSVSEVTTLPPLSAADERQLTVRRARVVRIVKALGNNPTQVAVLESPAASEEKLTPASSVELLAERGGELRIKYTATATARLVINITYDPGWQATLISNEKSQPIPVQRANRLMCSVLVPAGEQELHLYYQPREFTLGAILSGSSWLVWLVVLFTLRRRAISSKRL